MPWRHRLSLIRTAVESAGLQAISEEYTGLKRYYTQIAKTSSTIDLSVYATPANNYEYIAYLMEMFISEIDSIVNELQGMIPKPHYSDVCKISFQKIVFDRLKSGIVPNVAINSDLTEIPIDFRNIVMGTWLYLCEQSIDNYENFNQISRMANLLSLKGIELSFLQSHIVK